MYLYIHIIVLFSAIILYVYYDAHKIIWSSYNNELLLAIGILSAKENFALREAIRSTWLNEYLPNKNSSIKGWFIVGKNDCITPPQYRISKYHCNKWNVSKTDLKDNFYTLHGSISVACTSNSQHILRQGFSFKVNHPVIVKKLGVLFSLLVPNAENKVAILDIQTKEIIVQAKLTKNSSFLVNGYLYEDVEPTLLPKNYEGMVLVEGYLQYATCSNILWNDGGGVITFDRIYSTPSHISSMKFKSNLYSAASIYFIIHDMVGLKKIISEEDLVTSEWLNHLNTINQKLHEESKTKKDILFVDVIETYRNLPLKLLNFYRWIDNNYKFAYVMKTDDDTIVNIPYLMESLKNKSLNSDEKWLWSRFRSDWPVNYVGKWADYDYKSSIYPSFPCGAAYVMSSKILKWLSSNSENLFPYQGEDVSMGIWLQAINPEFIDDLNFECDSKCSIHSYNRVQLTVHEIFGIWEMYKKYNNLCSGT